MEKTWKSGESLLEWPTEEVTKEPRTTSKELQASLFSAMVSVSAKMGEFMARHILQKNFFFAPLRNLESAVNLTPPKVHVFGLW